MAICGAPSFLDTCFVQFTLPYFIVKWRQHAVVCVLAVRVVKRLNVVHCPAAYA